MSAPLRCCSALLGVNNVRCTKPAVYVVEDVDGMHSFACEDVEHQNGQWGEHSLAVKRTRWVDWHRALTEELQYKDAVGRLAAQASVRAGVLNFDAPDARGLVPIGFEAIIQAGGTVSISVVVPGNLSFTGRRLVIPDGKMFMLEELRVGHRNQLPHGRVTAAAWVLDGIAFYNMPCERAPPHMNIDMQVANITGVQRMFRAALYGEVHQ